MCVRDGETAGPWGDTLEVMERVGASAGAPHAGEPGEPREPSKASIWQLHSL